MNNANGSVFKYPDNVDTDVIIPARHLNTQDAKELASHCMEDIDKDFVKKVKDGDIMVGGWNFGCGSSREHAPWALDEYGFRTVIAPSFADIFFNNSFKNGLLPIILKDEEVDELFAQCEATEGYQLTVDLAAQTVTRPDGKQYSFEVDAFRKHCLLNGFDDIGLTLQDADAIRSFEGGYKQQQPWLFRDA